jgi:polyhydroxybutyrate depolymerase
MLNKLFIIAVVISTLCLLGKFASGRMFGNWGMGGDYRVPQVEIKGSATRGSYGPGNYVRTIESGGRKRFYEFHIPGNYHSSTPTPVVLVFHGGGGNPDAVRHQSGMDRVSDRHGFIAVYPAGTGLFYDRLLHWNARLTPSYAVKHNIDDVGFVRNLLDDLGRYFNVDPRRVYSTGISNGAMFSYLLAWELPSRIAAIGPISGGLMPPARSGARPVSIIDFHGTADRFYPFKGGYPAFPLPKTNFTGIPSIIRAWVAYDGLPSNPTRTFTVGAATCTVYGPSGNNVEIRFWAINGGGHTWPGGSETRGEERWNMGALNRDINASELMWEFFKAHPMQ